MECGCNITASTGDNIIEFCPIHAAGPQLVEALDFMRMRFIALQKKATMRGVTKRQLQEDAYQGQLECNQILAQLRPA